MPAGRQIFKIEPDGTTTELFTEDKIKDLLETSETYIVIDDEIRKVFLWKGLASSVRSKFIGAKKSQEIRGQVGMHYSTASIDEGDEDQDFLDVIGGKTAAGIAKEIKADEETAAGPMRARPTSERPSSVMGSSKGSVRNTGPLYTGQGSMGSYTEDDQQANFEQIMQKLEEIQIPPGYERELIIIGNYAYSVVEKVQNFLGKKQVEKVIEKVGSIPEGVFFAKEYSPRVLSENGKILAIEFLRNTGAAAPATKAAPKPKKQILQDQLRQQLG